MPYRLFLPFILFFSACSARQVVEQAELTGNAGCMIVNSLGVLLIKDFNSELAFPGGSAEAGESAEITAVRETYEEAGIKVRVGSLLHHFSNGFYLFACHPIRKIEVPLLVPESAAGEVKEILLLPCDSLEQEHWRFPDQFQRVPEICKSLLKS